MTGTSFFPTGDFTGPTGGENQVLSFTVVVSFRVQNEPERLYYVLFNSSNPYGEANALADLLTDDPRIMQVRVFTHLYKVGG